MNNDHWNIDKELEKLGAEIVLNQQNKLLNCVTVSSIEVLMAMMSKNELDRQSIENPIMFLRRYRMERPKAVRQKLIDIQNKYEWSDRDMRILHSGGLLSVSYTDVRLKPNKLIIIGGWIQIVIMSLICFPMIFSINLSHITPAKQLLADLLLGAVWYVSAWYFVSQYIRPWRIFKRSSNLVLYHQTHNIIKI